MTIHERYPFVWKESRKKEVKVKEESVRDKALKQDVGVLTLSTRSYHALKRASINTISDLLVVEDLSRIRNLGAKSVTEIQTKIKEYISTIE